MKFNTALILIAGFLVQTGKGYVAGVNPRLVSTNPTTIRPFEVKQSTSEGSKSQQKSAKTSSYDDSQIIFLSSVENSNEKSYFQDTPERKKDDAAFKTFSSQLIITNQKPWDVHLSRYSSGYPFERDDEDDRPIWNK